MSAPGNSKTTGVAGAKLTAVSSLHADIIIVGGGVAGLWVLAALRHAGYRALLLEQSALGAGQTLAAQGIIHGGAKYALPGNRATAMQAVRDMPRRWRAHFANMRYPELGAVEQTAQSHLMWAAGGVVSRWTAALAARVTGARALGPSSLPPLLRGRRAYVLDEPVVAVKSVLACLAATSEGFVLRGRALAAQTRPGAVELRVAIDSGGDKDSNSGGNSGGETLSLQAQAVIYAAGAGNAPLCSAAMQLRPLHMVLAKGELPPLWGHVIDAAARPRLTITSHAAADNPADKQRVWYLGGRLAERGVAFDPVRQIAAARAELAKLLPTVNTASCTWATFTINRAEGRQADGGRPAAPVLIRPMRSAERQIALWPTKLALAPLAADEALEAAREMGIRPARAHLELPNLPAATLGRYPWEAAHWQTEAAKRGRGFEHANDRR